MRMRLLESRRLLSATLVHGTLSIAGTAAAEVIDVTFDEQRIRVAQSVGSAQAEVSSFDLARVERIVVRAGGGDDTVHLGADHLDLSVNPRTDIRGTVFAGAGNDTVVSILPGICRGGAGADTLEANGATVLAGGDGDDSLWGAATLLGGNGDDVLSVDPRAPAGMPVMWPDLQLHGALLWGGAGNDTITGSRGVDWIDGGSGDDVIDTNQTGRDFAFGRSGNDTLRGIGTLHGNGGADWVGGGDGVHATAIFGDAGADVLYGSGWASLAGGDGDDTLVGQLGTITFNGGAGNDRMATLGGTALIDGGTGIDSVTAPAGLMAQHTESRFTLTPRFGADAVVAVGPDDIARLFVFGRPQATLQATTTTGFDLVATLVASDTRSVRPLMVPLGPLAGGLYQLTVLDQLASGQMVYAVLSFTIG